MPRLGSKGFFLERLLFDSGSIFGTFTLGMDGNITELVISIDDICGADLSGNGEGTGKDCERGNGSVNEFLSKLGSGIDTICGTVEPFLKA